MFTWTELSREFPWQQEMAHLILWWWYLIEIKKKKKKPKVWLISSHGPTFSKSERIIHFVNGGGKHQEHQSFSKPEQSFSKLTA